MATDPRILTIIDGVIFPNEGGYSNHPDDRGGETMYGITIGTARANGYNGSMRDLTRDMAREIYSREYIEGQGYDQIEHFGTMAQVASMGVMSGPEGQRTIIGRAVGQTVSTQAEAVAAINAYVAEHGPEAFAQRFADARLGYYRGLDSWPSFGEGWTNRVRSEAALGAVDSPEGLPNFAQLAETLALDTMNFDVARAQLQLFERLNSAELAEVLEGYGALEGRDAFVLQGALLGAMARDELTLTPEALEVIQRNMPQLLEERGLLSEERLAELEAVPEAQRAEFVRQNNLYELDGKWYDLDEARFGEHTRALAEGVGTAFGELTPEQRDAMLEDLSRERDQEENLYRNNLREQSANALDRLGGGGDLDPFMMVFLLAMAMTIEDPELRAQVMQDIMGMMNGTAEGPPGVNDVYPPGRGPSSRINGAYTRPELEDFGGETLAQRRLDLDMSLLRPNANGIALVVVPTGDNGNGVMGEVLAVDVRTGIVMDSFTFEGGGAGPGTERQTNGISPGLSGELDFEQHPDLTARWGITGLVYGGRNSWTDSDGVTWHVQTDDPIRGAGTDINGVSYTDRSGMWIHPSNGGTWGCLGMRSGDNARFRRYWEQQGGFPEMTFVTQEVYQRSLRGEVTVGETGRDAEAPATPATPVSAPEAFAAIDLSVFQSGEYRAILDTFAKLDSNNDNMLTGEELAAGLDSSTAVLEAALALESAGVDVRGRAEGGEPDVEDIESGLSEAAHGAREEGAGVPAR